MTTKSTKRKQITLNRHFFETDYFPIEKKNRSGQFRTKDLWHPRRIGYLPKKCAGDAKLLNDSSDSVNQIVISNKSLYSNLITPIASLINCLLSGHQLGN